MFYFSFPYYWVLSLLDVSFMLVEAVVLRSLPCSINL